MYISSKINFELLFFFRNILVCLKIYFILKVFIFCVTLYKGVLPEKNTTVKRSMYAEVYLGQSRNK